MQLSPRHFLYPLNPKAKRKYHLEDNRGNPFPTSVEGFFDCYANGGAAEWRIHQGVNDLKAKDYIWVHFALPVSAIMAVGRVRKVPHFNKKWNSYAIWIDWDWKRTKQLQENPIPYAAHRQTVQVSVCEANLKTQNVIDRWMQGSLIGRTPRALKPIKFKRVLVEQRQGQADFRQALMVAYDYKCAVTGCDVRDTLQAAHIVPVSNSGQHHVHNGLLLRADIHNLFDRGLLTIDKKYIVRLDSSIHDSKTYKSLHGKKLVVVPTSKKYKPSLKHLEQHRKFHKAD
jgi:hypothetical protein